MTIGLGCSASIPPSGSRNPNHQYHNHEKPPFLFDAFRIKNHSDVNLRGCSVKEVTERYNAITAWRNKQYLSQKSKPVFSIQFVMNIVRQFKIYTYANKLFFSFNQYWTLVVELISTAAALCNDLSCSHWSQYTMQPPNFLCSQQNFTQPNLPGSSNAPILEMHYIKNGRNAICFK